MRSEVRTMNANATARIKADRDNSVTLLALYRAGEYALADELADKVFPKVSVMAQRVDPDKARDHYTAVAQMHGMYDRCVKGHYVRADLIKSNGECPECEEDKLARKIDLAVDKRMTAMVAQIKAILVART